jgi:putative transposase
VIEAIQKHIESHPTHGFPKTFAYLRRAGKTWNHKKVYRVYTLLRYNKRRKGKRRLPQRIKRPMEQLTQINQSWSIDFMSDSLACGRRFRTFNVIDDYNREVLAIDIATSIPAVHVTRILDQIVAWRGTPTQMRMDNGPEFISNELKLWCEKRQIEQLFIQPGKPTQNSLIERFNGSYRRDILDAYLFFELEEVRSLTHEWIEEYNLRRPHASLANKTPAELAGVGSRASFPGRAQENLPGLHPFKENSLI